MYCAIPHHTPPHFTNTMTALWIDGRKTNKQTKKGKKHLLLGKNVCQLCLFSVVNTVFSYLSKLWLGER